MRIGVPKEIKIQEGRVAITPKGVQCLLSCGHDVLVERSAGVGAGFLDAEYQEAGAILVSAEEAWATDLVVKVKEPLPSEYPFLGKQILFTFLHLAGVDPALTLALLDKGTTALAYETLVDADGRLPLLAPMSAIAGNMATLMGAYYLANFNGGKGIQLGRVLDQRHGKVVVIGDGVVGQHAAQVACGMGAEVWLAGIDWSHLQSVQKRLPEVSVFLSNRERIVEQLREADLVVGAVLCPGAHAPQVVDLAMVKSMQPGSVIVDVSIDQGGCIETSRPTTHADPVFVEHGVVHYCVTNMPGAYPRTSTLALADKTLPYIVKIAQRGQDGIVADPVLRSAINTFAGKLTCLPVAEGLNLLDRFDALPCA